MTDTGTSRRGLLGVATNLLMAAIAVIVAVPGVGYFISPLLKRTGAGDMGATFQDAGPVADIPVGEWRLLSVETVQQDGWRKSRVKHSVWVRRQDQGEQAISVLSPICPHLGCPINWHPDQAQFNCPCHGGLFDASGNQTGGPPPRAMDSLEFEVRGGRLWVRWQDFKIGVAERVPVSV
jgi:menaquinol-cytochrome c reductase iron-sulfur subunit